MVGFSVGFNFIVMLNNINFIMNPKLYPTFPALCFSNFLIDYIASFITLDLNCFSENKVSV